MAQITATLVKELRNKTGSGMMDCKKALGLTNGDIEEAIDWLRTKGLAAAQKKSGRIAAEGLVGLSLGSNTGAVIEINSETDFVAKNSSFQGFVKTVAELALGNESNMDVVFVCKYPGTERTVSEQLSHNVATIGENMNIRRMKSLSVQEGVISGYIHNAEAEGVGKIAVLVSLESSVDKTILESLGKQIAMHVAATNPQSLNIEGLDPELIEREKLVQIEKARESGKPDNIIDKIIEGRMRKYYEEVVLLEQVFVIDGERKISQVVSDTAKEAGAEISILSFIRFEIGEGIEKKEEDFAAEVRATAGI
jgi:elongation factor Ts